MVPYAIIALAVGADSSFSLPFPLACCYFRNDVPSCIILERRKASGPDAAAAEALLIEERCLDDFRIDSFVMCNVTTD